MANRDGETGTAKKNRRAGRSFGTLEEIFMHHRVSRPARLDGGVDTT